eukprot:gene1445-1822_t
MILKPLPKGKLMSHVQFTTEWNSNFYDPSTCDLITRVGIEEMTLVFTQGRWNYAEWGYPVRASPVGVELIAWLRPLEKGIDAQWRELTHSLSGLFCASMHFLYQVPHHTSSPSRSFRPEGSSNIYHSVNYLDNLTMKPAIFNTQTNKTQPLELRYGILPRESVCTENLTPWVKLLPCREQGGIGKLLNPLRLYDVHYHSMSITIRKICKDSVNCKIPTLEIVQSLTIVNDIASNQNQNGKSKKVEVGLETLFGIKTGLSSCPLASSSRIYVQNQNHLSTDLQLTPEPNQKLSSPEFSIYDLKDYTTANPLKLKLSWSKTFNTKTTTSNVLSNSQQSQQQQQQNPTPIIAHSHLTGYGQERGGIAIQIFNQHHSPINITFFQAVPWYLRLYFHTFRFMINHREFTDSDFIFKRVSPAETRSSPSTIELSFQLPAHSVASMSIDFDKVFLHYTEHPPDANRGFDLSSGVVTAYLDPKEMGESFAKQETIDIEWSSHIYPVSGRIAGSNQSSIIPVRIYTEGLLITLPTPDFSMLYNVITLTGTVFALFFGSMLNILIKRLKKSFTGDGDFVSDRPIAKIYRKLMDFIDGGSNSNKNE